MRELILCQKISRFWREKKIIQNSNTRKCRKQKYFFCIKLQQLGTGQKAEIRYKDDNTL